MIGVTGDMATQAFPDWSTLYPGGPDSGFTGYADTGGISQPIPYVEQDTQARLGAIFSGISSTISSVGKALAEIRYAPKPVTGLPTPISSGQQKPVGGFRLGTATISTGMIVAIVAVVGIVWYLKRRR